MLHILECNHLLHSYNMTLQNNGHIYLVLSAHSARRVAQKDGAIT